MNDTIKLIIEIPKSEYKLITGDEADGLNPLTRAVANGVPLYSDDVNMVVIEKYSKSIYTILLMKVLKKLNIRLDNLHIETRPISPEQETKFLYYNMGVDDCLKVLNNTWESVTK